ncbi:MAG: EF-P lysine aminoacylase GenX [Pirellulaceae bacterium]|nr:EF-P lysine aminoacylase GenX [Pirellulaceae bacterium]
MLTVRAALLKRLRAFFDSRGFLEVETPLLSRDVVVDRHLDPLSTTLFADPREPQVGPRLWLQTSPEFAMKRLLVAGKDELGAIYQVTRAFRGGEAGLLHNPEFTIVEWYRVGDDYAAGMQLLADLTEEMLGWGAPERLKYREAFLRYADVDPFENVAADHDLHLDLLLTQKVEPHLGQACPTILYDYPASQAALAQIREGNPPVAERFELYVRGIELANGYHELLDPAVLRERNRVNNQLRQDDGKPPLPADSRLLAAMDHGLPACSGCALGFDRLVMAATGAKTIQEVMAFPIDRA